VVTLATGWPSASLQAGARGGRRAPLERRTPARRAELARMGIEKVDGDVQEAARSC
jgi:hypothetical protein